jgi:predicted alpha/beta-fold hydrolase
MRRLDLERFPVTEELVETEPGVRVLVHLHNPMREPAGHIVTLHGLEGSSEAGYVRSMAQLALEHGYAVHRTNMRSCGGTDDACRTMYHAGLTSDTLHLLRRIREGSGAPIFLAGYSLGGNVALKLAGELGAAGPDLLAGVVAVSVPIDLAACVHENRLYEWRFLRALRNRIKRRAAIYPGVHAIDKLNRVRSVYEFDDVFVAPFFGFGTADNYYATQSSIRFLASIRTPALIIQAKDDPMIPFGIFSDSRLTGNPNITLLPVEHGGHLGFIANAAPRFWLDRVILRWIEEIRNNMTAGVVSQGGMPRET